MKYLNKMPYKNLATAIAIIALWGCSETRNEFTIANPAADVRQDEVIIFTREQLAEKVTPQEARLPVFRSGDLLLSSQVDDLNGDGIWDEAVVLMDLAPEEQKTVQVEWVAEGDYPEFEKRTNLRLGILQEDGSYKEMDSYRALPCSDGFEVIAQAESVNWENDKMGFRNYFDCRNVKDLFGKLKPGLVIDKIHTPELPSYHDLADWGMDVLHCGSSLGSGGIALLKNDSLFRLGSTGVYEYQKIIEGPVRSIFELRYRGWLVDGDTLEAVERITIYPGKYWFESDVTVTGCPEGSQIVTGIVTSHLKREPFQLMAGNYQVIGTHDIQSLNNDELGMAVMVPASEAGKIDRTSDINFAKLGYVTVPEKGFSNIISETYYIGQNCSSDKPAKHYFAAVWGLDQERWKSEEGFRSYLEEEAQKLSNPVVVE